MSHWNHRAIIERHTHPDGTVETQIAIHEVYYDDESQIVGWAKSAASASADDLDGLRITLERMLEALGKPVLDPETVELRPWPRAGIQPKKKKTDEGTP